MTNNFVSLKDFTDLNNNRYVKKEIPSLGFIYIYKMSFKERLEYEAKNTGSDDKLDLKSPKAMTELIQVCVCNEMKKRMFDDSDGMDVLMALESRIAQFLFAECITENYANLKSAEELEKN